MAMSMKATKVVTGKARLSFAHVWEPASVNGSNPKYSASVIIPKHDTDTMRDGDTDRPDDEAYRDSYFINCNSTTAPQIVDRSVQPILDREEVYSGCYVRVSINFYAYNSSGNKGIAAGLGNIQKIADGEPLGGKTNARDEFSSLDDDDFLN